MVVVRTQLSTRAVAVAAGVVLALLPRVTWAGIEARSYALCMVAGVWLTVLCLTAIRRNGLRWWSGYAALVVLGTLFERLRGAHRRRPRRHWCVVSSDSRSVRVRWAWRRWSPSPVVPFLYFTQTQLFQVGLDLARGPSHGREDLAGAVLRPFAGVRDSGSAGRRRGSGVPVPGHLPRHAARPAGHRGDRLDRDPHGRTAGVLRCAPSVYYPRYLSFTCLRSHC